jgi:hypothetical protein
MDPYLEHPAIWQDVHNSLIAAMRDVLSPLVAPRYYVALERRAYLLTPDDIVFVGRPDLSVATKSPMIAIAPTLQNNGVLEIELPINEEIGLDYLEIHEVVSGQLITVIELLSPTNKINQEGRQQYLQKRLQTLRTRTNLIEIDLLRAGEPMPFVSRPLQSDYRILISRSHQRPRGQLHYFNLRQAIPSFSVPLLPGESEPVLDLNTILHDLYARARFDLRLDYTKTPVPPLSVEDDAWAKTLRTSR